MSEEHNLAKEARKEMLQALTNWMFSVRSKTLAPEEEVLYNKAMAYFKLKRVTGQYRVPPKTGA